jgi:hypothetical protein
MDRRGRSASQAHRPTRCAHRPIGARMSQNALIRVEHVCTELATSGQPITFTAVAAQAPDRPRNALPRPTTARHHRRTPDPTNRRAHPDRPGHRSRSPTHRRRSPRRRRQTPRGTTTEAHEATTPTMNHSARQRSSIDPD